MRTSAFSGAAHLNIACKAFHASRETHCRLHGQDRGIRAGRRDGSKALLFSCTFVSVQESPFSLLATECALLRRLLIRLL